MTKGYKVILFEEETMCYGDLLQTSNFEVVCENEDDDSIWCVGHPNGRDWIDWDDVVTTLQGYYNSSIVEISAI